jgi:radical SAM superfamily enzyme YgiQ (UPF0313 family)
MRTGRGNVEKPRKKTFEILLIKPSKYDDDGYVLRWFRGVIPSNSLAVMNAITMDAVERQVLGPDVDIKISVIDEMTSRIDIPAIVRRFRNNDNYGLIGLVGVQSNQYPRAIDIASELRKADIPLIMGGFHVSGLTAMFSERTDDLKQALDLGVSLFVGEAEGRFETVIRDAAAGNLKEVYNYITDLPDIGRVPVPFLPRRQVRRTLDGYTSFDAGRGCPFQCSFCTIINVQGRKSRSRSADDIEELIRKNAAQEVTRFFITDDNFARNKDWEVVLDRIIDLREGEGMDIRLIIQVDTLCHRIPNFIDKARRAGVQRVFIGLENINPDNLLAAKKRQNKITEYRAMMQAWKEANIITYAGYILGFPNDTPESIRRDIGIIKRELPIDILEFFFLTPLPGSEDHKTLSNNGIEMDPDMNKYDLEHVTTAHAIMSKEEWQNIYDEAWQLYYTPEHIETVLRRARGFGAGISRLAGALTWFSCATSIENVHPLQFGILRLKNRKDRRPDLPIEPPWQFYPRYFSESTSKLVRLIVAALKIEGTRRRVAKDPDAAQHFDRAMEKVVENDDDQLEMYTHSTAARDAVTHIRKVAKITRQASRSRA